MIIFATMAMLVFYQSGVPKMTGVLRGGSWINNRVEIVLAMIESVPAIHGATLFILLTPGPHILCVRSMCCECSLDIRSHLAPHLRLSRLQGLVDQGLQHAVIDGKMARVRPVRTHGVGHIQNESAP